MKASVVGKILLLRQEVFSDGTFRYSCQDSCVLRHNQFQTEGTKQQNIAGNLLQLKDISPRPVEYHRGEVDSPSEERCSRECRSAVTYRE